MYLDAANPVNGQSLVDVAGPIIDMARPLGEVVDGVELVLLPAPGAGAFYGVTDPDDLAWMDERLTGHPWQCFEQPLGSTNEDALWAIPQYHIVCTDDAATPRPGAHGRGARRGPALGHRHRPRPDDHRARRRHRGVPRGRRRLSLGAATTFRRVSLDLTDRRALVTGAGQGVGRGIALGLAAAGADVVVNDFVADRAERGRGRDPRPPAATASAPPFDVTDHDAVHRGRRAVAAGSTSW